MARRSYGSGSLFSRQSKSGGETWYGHWGQDGRQIKRRIGPKRTAGSRERLTRRQAEAKLLIAERDENTFRNDFTPSEAVALGRRLEELERPAALQRVAEAGRSAAPGRPPESSGNSPGLSEKGDTRYSEAMAVAELVGELTTSSERGRRTKVAVSIRENVGESPTVFGGRSTGSLRKERANGTQGNGQHH